MMHDPWNIDLSPTNHPLTKTGIFCLATSRVLKERKKKQTNKQTNKQQQQQHFTS